MASHSLAGSSLDSVLLYPHMGSSDIFHSSDKGASRRSPGECERERVGHLRSHIQNIQSSVHVWKQLYCDMAAGGCSCSGAETTRLRTRLDLDEWKLNDLQTNTIQGHWKETAHTYMHVCSGLSLRRPVMTLPGCEAQTCASLWLNSVTVSVWALLFFFPSESAHVTASASCLVSSVMASGEPSISSQIYSSHRGRRRKWGGQRLEDHSRPGFSTSSASGFNRG